jgi:DeoR/GlpR family transcriptional regulator of sugar metabolism
MHNKQPSEGEKRKILIQQDNMQGRGQRETYFEGRDKLQIQAKELVAAHVVEKYLKDGDSILLDAGTSLYPIAQQIISQTNERPCHYTIMTHNFKAFQILVSEPKQPSLNIVLAGGRYDEDLNALFGPQTTSNYEEFHPRVVLIGISGLTAEVGLFCHGNTEELFVKQTIFKKRCRDKVIVADYTKIGMPDALCFGRIQDLIDADVRCALVTTTPPSDENETVKGRYRKQIEILRQKKINVDEVELPRGMVSQAEPQSQNHSDIKSHGRDNNNIENDK